jgi:uncharacterized damage-inducible protein DinB
MLGASTPCTADADELTACIDATFNSTRAPVASAFRRTVAGHQAHHRGQMTVLMRQAGLTVPGVYGPAREERAQWGTPAED